MVKMKIVCLGLIEQTAFGVLIAVYLTLAIYFDLMVFSIVANLESGAFPFIAVVLGLTAPFILPIWQVCEMIKETKKLQRAEARREKKEEV